MRRLLLLGFLIAPLPEAALAAETSSDTSKTLQLFSDEALNLKAVAAAKEAQVVTASRRKVPILESPMSVEVITADDIRAAGVVNIWDLLRFRAGMDVDDANHADGLAVVSIRGFARGTVRQIQVLIDGRSVITPSRSAVNWEQLPVQLQDVERIEIVRGPNGVLFGSNAGFGVINIITKKPAAARELSAGGLAGNENLFRSQAAAQESIGGFHFRLSQTHTTRDGTSRQGGGAAGDFVFSNKQNFRGRWDIRPGTSLETFAGGSWDTLGTDVAAGAGALQSRYRQHFEMARLTQKMSRGQLEFTGARNENNTDQEGATRLTHLREFQYDGELLYRLNWLDGRMNTTSGGSYRQAVAESDQLFTGDPKQQNRIFRGFVNQHAQLSDRVIVTGGVSLEHSDTSGYEPAYQFAGVIEAAEDHAFRLSYSFAPTLPSLIDEHANSQSSPTSKRIGNPHLDSDHLSSYEIGYQGVWGGGLTVGTNLFYLDHRDLNETVVVSNVGPLTTKSVDNSDAAIARGAEAILKFKFDSRRELYANYTYEHTTDKSGNLEVTNGIPAHKFNLGGRAPLGLGFSISVNAGYKDAYASGSATSGFIDVPAYWRLDGRLAYDPRPGLELFVAGQNLGGPFHSQEFKGSAPVPRTFQGGATVKF